MTNNCIPKEHFKKWKEINEKCYEDQCKYFLNAFWEEHKKNAEECWKYCELFAKLDEKKHERGKELDEFVSHKFLEQLGETLTVIELREKLRLIDIDNNKMMSASEYLLFKYKADVTEFLTRPQGDPAHQKMIKEAEKKVNNASAELHKMQKALDEAKAAEEEGKKALAELKKEEDAYNSAIKKNEDIAADTSLGLVKQNKAKQVIAQLKATDPLPLRKAKLTQEAAVRRIEKARKVVEEATNKTQKAYQEALAVYNEVKVKAGSCAGTLWWMERQLTETKKYLPRKTLNF